MPDNNENQASESSHNAGAQKYELNPDWTIGEVLTEAWRLKDGFKGIYWGAVLIFLVIAAITSSVLGTIGDDGSLTQNMMQLATGLITYPLIVGIMMIAIRRSVGIPTNALMVFDYYPRTIPIFLLYLLMMVMLFIGFLLLVIPGIYLSIAYMLAMPLLVDKHIGIWEALEASRKPITACWFRTFGLVIIGSLIMIISAIPLGIGLIWTLPFLGLTMAIVYRNLMGVSQSA